MQETEVILKSESPLAVYSEFRKQLIRLKTDNAAAVFNYTTQEGSKEAKSHIYKLRKTKGAVEKARKEEKAESLRYGRLVDAEAKELAAEIDEMIEIHDKPLREFEEREADRVQTHKDHIDGMRQAVAQTEHPDGRPMDAAEYLMSVKYIEELKIDELWEEFADEAAEVRDECLVIAKRRLSDRVQHEAEQAELARLRKEAKEREDREAAEAQARATEEREERIRREGEERARKAAEEEATAAKEKAERERKEAADKEESERKAVENRELELRLAAEKAERGKAEAEQRAAQAEKDAKEKAELEVKEKAEREAAEAAKREALVAGGIDDAIARSCVTLIA